jgi:glutamine synthetase
VLPAAVRHQTEVALNLGALKAAGAAADVALLAEVSGPLGDLRSALATLKSALAAWTGPAEEEATYAYETLIPAMAAVRGASDLLEGVVALIVNNIIDLGHQLGLKVVAEGVETPRRSPH